SHFDLVSNGYDEPRRQADEHAREQSFVLTRDRASRTDTRASSAGLHVAALQHPSSSVSHAVPGGRLGALLGNAALGHEFPTQRGRSRGHAFLAVASLRAHHFFAQI